METLFNFFALRPVFTFVGLRLVWYLYLTHVIFSTLCFAQYCRPFPGPARYQLGGLGTQLHPSGD